MEKKSLGLLIRRCIQLKFLRHTIKETRVIEADWWWNVHGHILVSSLCILHDANLVSKRYLYIYIYIYIYRPVHYLIYFLCFLDVVLLHAENSQNKQIMLKNEWNDIIWQFRVSLLNCFTLWQHPASHWMCCSTFFCYNLALLKYQIIQTQ